MVLKKKKEVRDQITLIFFSLNYICISREEIRQV